MPTRIALIHATPLAMQPVKEAFERGWGEAETVNVLDDALSRDLDRAGELNTAMKQRIAALAAYVTGTRVEGILYTCSAFGEAIDAVAQSASMPVLKPNEAMFAEALHIGTTVGLLATFQPSVPSMAQEFEAMAVAQGKQVQLETVWVPDAMQALSDGKADRHDHLIAAAARSLAHCDVVMLAQFSMARALAPVQQALRCPVLSSPDSAVAKLKAMLT